MKVIGMMSGTSFDAIDAAVADLDLDGDTLHLTPRGSLSRPYPATVREALLGSLPPARITMEAVCQLDTSIGQAFADLAAEANHDLCHDQADLVVAHGQTVFHWTEGNRVLGTLQLGEPAWIAERTGLSVVADLRSRDVTAGGQGAPLVSALDVLWLKDRSHRSVALNLGGIANVTVVDPQDEPVAFDVGPANALIDAVVHRVSDGELRYDVDGNLAARGQINAELLTAMLAEPYYRRPAPKSTGKELFNLGYVEAFTAVEPGQDAADLIATLTALSAETVADAVRAAGAREVVAAGGGTRNPTMMRILRDRLSGVAVVSSDELGLPAAAKEAYAFAMLGFLTVCGLPSTVPSCTGAQHASILGSVTPGRGGVVRPMAATTSPTRLLVHFSGPATHR